MDNSNVNELYKEITNFHIPRWNELPDLDLYLDQISSLLEKYLSIYIKNQDKEQDEEKIKNKDKKRKDKKDKEKKDSKIITKAMINNYVNTKILDAPVNKKYNKIHIAKLFVISILKQIYSINDINNLINLALKTSKIETAYDEFCNELEKAIYSTFNYNKFEEYTADLPKEKYILKNVVKSFACKLYVEKAYLLNN